MSVVLLVSLLASAGRTVSPTQGTPSIQVYKTVGNTALKVHVFKPSVVGNLKTRAAIVLLHGGGWTAGSPEWVYYEAKHYADLGMVSIAVEYRLADQNEVTPLDALDDTRDAIRWVRSHARALGVNPHEVAAYGVSAGGHLASSAAIFGDSDKRISGAPDALVLLSPALDVEDDNWFKKLLGKRADSKESRPHEFLRRGFPPMIVFVGESDTETPLPGIRSFCDAVKRTGGSAELITYKGVGHLLSRNLDPRAQEQGPFDPDPIDRGDAQSRSDKFLVKLGYVEARR